MDLDQDGVKDLITGSPSGQLQFFKGDGKGNFDAGVHLMNESGEALKVGSYANFSVVDWNGDGILDVAHYSSGKGIQLRLGQGDLKYGEAAPLQIGERKLEDLVKIHDGRVLFYDWDEDGTPDLIFSNGDGSVTFFRGTRGASKELVLSDGIPWMTAFDHTKVRVKDYETMEFNEPRAGRRPTITVTDWNGDGKPDLLIGDLFVCFGKHDYTEAQLEEKTRLDEELQAAYETTGTLLAEANRHALRSLGLAEDTPHIRLTQEQRAQYKVIYDEVVQREPLRSLIARRNVLMEEVRKYNIPLERFGYVWVYLSK